MGSLKLGNFNVYQLILMPIDHRDKYSHQAVNLPTVKTCFMVNLTDLPQPVRVAPGGLFESVTANL